MAQGLIQRCGKGIMGAYDRRTHPMAPPRLVVRPRHLNLSLPEDLHASLEAHLTIPTKDGPRVPKGAYQDLFISLLRAYFKEQGISLSKSE